MSKIQNTNQLFSTVLKLGFLLALAVAVVGAAVHAVGCDPVLQRLRWRRARSAPATVMDCAAARFGRPSEAAAIVRASTP